MPEPVVPVFIPPLLDLLARAEEQKGTALTREEVISICGKGVCMMMRQSHADKMAQSRGYADLDPTLCWEQWLVAREQRARGG
jgi:hypothetical protein